LIHPLPSLDIHFHDFAEETVGNPQVFGLEKGLEPVFQETLGMDTNSRLQALPGENAEI